MKKVIYLSILISALIFGGCKKKVGCMDLDADNYDGEAEKPCEDCCYYLPQTTTSSSSSTSSNTSTNSTSSYSCNPYYGQNNCPSNFLPVSSTYCCPTSSPYWDGSTTSSCHVSCPSSTTSYYGGASTGTSSTSVSSTSNSSTISTSNSSTISTSNSSTNSTNSTYGTFTVYIDYDCICSPINIYLNGNYVGSLTGYYTSGTPSCGTNSIGAVTFNVQGSNNTWYADAPSTGSSWTGGTFTVPAGGCQLIQLQ